jgi:hypothetical protein
MPRLKKWNKKKGKKRRHKERRRGADRRIRYADDEYRFRVSLLTDIHDGRIEAYLFKSGSMMACVHPPLDGHFNCKQLKLDPVMAAAVNKAIVVEAVRRIHRGSRYSRRNEEIRYHRLDWKNERFYIR